MNPQPCFPKLTGLPVETLENIFKNLDDESKKNLRLTCHYLLYMSRRLEKTFLKFFMFSEISADRLKLLSDQVFTVKGVETKQLTGDSSSAHESMLYLIKHHGEMESFRIRSPFSTSSSCSSDDVFNSSFGDSSLEALLSHPNMRIIQLTSCSLTGKNLFQNPESETEPKQPLQGLDPGSRPKLSLKVLDLGSCLNLTDLGLVSLFNLVDGDSLTHLIFSGTSISLASLEDIATSFTKLEILALDACDRITNTSAISFLNRVGDELKDLNLSYTSISLANIEDLTSSLLNLETLMLHECPITDSSLISLLNRVGNKLKHLNLCDTEITLSNIDDLNTSFPSLELLDLSFCPYITQTGVFSLLNKVGTSVRLDIEGTPVDTREIKDLFPSVTVVGDSEWDEFVDDEFVDDESVDEESVDDESVDDESVHDESADD